MIAHGARVALAVIATAIVAGALAGCAHSTPVGSPAPAAGVTATTTTPAPVSVSVSVSGGDSSTLQSIQGDLDAANSATTNAGGDASAANSAAATSDSP